MAAAFISIRLLPFLLLLNLCFCFARLSPRQSCGQGYHLCSPDGASARDVPEIGPGLTRLYLNLVETVNPQPAPARFLKRSETVDQISSVENLDPATLVCRSNSKTDQTLTSDCSKSGYGCLNLVGGSFLDTMYHTGDDIPTCDKTCQCPQPLSPKPDPSVQMNPVDGKEKGVLQKRAMPGNLCCEDTTQCMLVLSYDIPVCWDRFTTNYYLSDGSYGSIVSGNYTTPEGDQVNLISGNFRMANGQSGNMYQEDQVAEPNTSSLPIPTPWTSSGVGSALQASEVGAQASSNSSGFPFLPTFTTASGTSSLSVVAMTTASASSTTSSMSNATSLTGSTVSVTLSSTATIASGTERPEITPPIRGGATAWAPFGLLLTMARCAVVTYLMMMY